MALWLGNKECFLGEFGSHPTKLLEKSNLGRYGHGDIWSNMLGYTNGVFNNFYGIRNRNAICHAPHLLDRRIMANMALKFAR